jgi:hypothetical protein
MSETTTRIFNTSNLRDASMCKVRTSGKLSLRYSQILHCMQMAGSAHPVTNRILSRTLRLPINCITGRVKELRSMGLVGWSGTVYDTVTRRHVSKWNLTEKGIKACSAK